MTHPESKPVLKDVPYGIQGRSLLSSALSSPARPGGRALTPRRQRRIADLQLRGLSERTQEREGRAGRPLAAQDHTAPARSTEAARRAAVLAVTHGQHAARRASPSARGGLTCFSAPTRQRAWTLLTCGRPPQAPTRPVVLRLAAGPTRLQGGRWPRARACRSPLSAWGLRRPEGTPPRYPYKGRFF